MKAQIHDGSISRREFLAGASGGTLMAGVLGTMMPVAAMAGDGLPEADDHRCTVIEGKPRVRGQRFGRAYAEAIRAFLTREILAPFAPEKGQREELLRYGRACAAEITTYSPEIHAELQGMAEAAEIQLEEAVLITLHEELYHRGTLPPVPHCTAIAAGPPDTANGNTYVAMTWDWMLSVFGISSIVSWKRDEGPSVLGYAYPGLWTGAGMNSAGIALCWTSASLGKNIDGGGPRVGIPTYVLITQMLYQKTLDDAINEARRARQAGWFTFVLADGKGQLANVEGSPRRLAVERSCGHLARVYYGTREMTSTPAGQPVVLHPKAQQAGELLSAAKGRLDLEAIRKILATSPITNEGTIDQMVFDTTARRAYFSRGPHGSGRWQEFDLY